MREMKLKQLLSLAAGMLLLASAVVGTFVWHKFDAIARAEAERKSATQAVLNLKDARFHVVQVQQFLTDVAATRDDGGFADASAHLQQAKTALRTLAANDPTLAARVSAMTDKLNTLDAVGTEMAQAYIDAGRTAGNAIMKRPHTGLDDTAATLATELHTLAAELEGRFGAAESATQRAHDTVRTSTITALMLLALTSLAVMMLVYQRLIPPLAQLLGALQNLKSGTTSDTQLQGLTADFRDVAGVFNGVLDNLNQQRCAEAAAATENRRVVEALDNVRSKVMLVDLNFDILYLNRTLSDGFEQIANTARRQWPNFDPRNLIGVSAGRFGAALLARQHANDATKEVVVAFAARSFRVTASPVCAADGAHLGTVLEWTDITDQQAAESQIQAMIGAAADGEFDRRLDLDTFEEGFLKQLASGMNHMLDTIIEPLPAVMSFLDLLGRGEIPPTITAEWRGELAPLKENMNRCTAAVARLLSDAERLAVAGVAGRLDMRADASAHAGAFRLVVKGVNDTLDAIVRPVAECKQVFTRMAAGDLTGRMSGDYQGEFAVLRDALHDSLDTLGHTVTDIRVVTASLQTATSEIAIGNRDLSQRTEDQGQNVERTTANMRQLAETVRHNASHTSAANELAASARQQAERGGDVVRRAITAMGEINGASTKIGDIISVINDIAFQTNLLALNAAVEAARAGEHGRGFAVVASEVRNLAQRSAAAAKEIKGLIQNSLACVNDGVQLVNDSGARLAEIVGSVKKVNELIADIASASTQQSMGIDEIAVALALIDEGTQQNAALVEQTAAASKLLSEQATQMRQLVANLRTDEQRDGRAPRLVSAA